MITKGSQRAGGQRLATHLLNAHDNERVELLEIRGSLADDLHGALSEWELTAKGTNCKKYLYSLSLNPEQAQRRLSRPEYLDFIARTEKTFGLTDQPRAIVFHVKNGREHAHVVWSRIDTDHMKAIEIAFDRRKLRSLDRDFSRELGLQHRKEKTLAEKFNARARQRSHAEEMQTERTGITKEQRTKDITQAWKNSDTARAFISALENLGYTLAQGDRRGYVLIDRHGEIHSLARQIEGVRTKQLKERLTAYPLESLPTVEQARKPKLESVKQITLKQHFKLQTDKRRAELAAAQRKRRDGLAALKTKMEQRHTRDLQALIAKHGREVEALANQREKGKLKGFKAFIGKITGITKLKKRKERQQDTRQAAEHAKAFDALKTAHALDLKDFARQERSLARVERKELKSLETKLRRELLIESRTLTKTQQHDLEQYRQNAADITAPEEDKKAKITDKFDELLKANEARRQAQKDRSKGRDRPKQ